MKNDDSKDSRHALAHTGARAGVSSLKYRPDLSAIRFPLMVFVITAHNSTSWSFGFWLVLTGWFSISGYLITLGFLTEKEKAGKISIRDFYIRRVFRLLPSLYFACSATLIYGWLTHKPNFIFNYLYSVLAAVFYYSDIWSVVTSGHGYGVVSQLWSLSIEEQFYLLWAPLVVIILYKKNKVFLLWTAIGITLFVCIYRVVLFELTHSPQRIYYAFDTRLDAIMIGCIVAVLASRGYFDSNIPRWYAKSAAKLAMLGLIGFVVLLFTVPGGSVFGSTYALSLTDVCWILILPYLVMTPDSRLAKRLNNRVLVHLGNITYDVYLWEWIVIVVIMPSFHLNNNFARFAVLVGVSLALSEMTYWSFEVPIKKLRKYRYTVKEMRGLTVYAP
ncbi:MAG: acyltransferase [Acidimicrobiales bacterium]|nr:acyltransferase [Acidimicrobiales bacterium]